MGETGKIIVADSKKLDGCVDIDSALKDVYKDANRWGYAIGYDSKVRVEFILPLPLR